MTSSGIDIARTYFQAVQTGDMAALGDLLDADIVWHQPGANQFSGEHKGQGAVFQMLGSMMETSQGTFAIDKIHTLMGNGRLPLVAGGLLLERRHRGNAGHRSTVAASLTPEPFIEGWLRL